MDEAKVARLVRELLVALGEDPEREGLARTPARVARAFGHILRGYASEPAAVVQDAVFTAESNNMILARDIEIYSMCEHHMLPFFGKCHIGYIPRGKLLGVSKLARLADLFGARLQLQERLTAQIAAAVAEATGAEGVWVVLECRHLCMMMRGVEKQNSVMTTSAVRGVFMSDPATRSEFLDLIGRPRPEF